MAGLHALLGRRPARAPAAARLARALLILAVAGLSGLRPALAVDRVVLQLQWDHQFQFAGYYAALWQGYYREAGIEVEIRPAVAPGQPLRSPAGEIGAGRAQFGTSNAGVLLALAQGAPLVILAAIFQQSGTRGYYRSETPIGSVADLLKLRLNRTRGNEFLDVELRALLAAEGIDPAQLTIVPSDADKLWQNLIDRRFDLMFGYSLSAPWESRELGIEDLRSLRPSDYGIMFYGDALIADARLAERNPDLVRRFRDASLRGWRHALDHPRAIAERITRELPRTLPLRDPLGFNLFQIDAVKELTLHPMVELGHMNPDRWARMRDGLLKAKVIDRSFPVEPILFDPERDRRRREEELRHWLVLGAGAALLGLALALGWTRSLRRAVAARTDELRDSEARYRALVDNSPECIFIVRVTPAGDFLYEGGNPAAAAVSGVPEAQMRGRLLKEFWDPDVIRRTYGHYRDCLETGGLVRFEFTRRDGAHTRETILVPLPGEDGRVARIIVSSRDVTARKEAEAALRQAQKMEAVGQLTGGLAHDFNNLLTVIISGLEGIGRARGNPERIERYAGLALEAADRGAKLTRQLLTFSRRQPLQARVIDVDGLVANFAALMGRAAGEAVELRVVPSPAPAHARIDPSGFEAAILNLVVNARDAMPSGGRILIETRVVDLPGGGPGAPAGGSYVAVSVSDTGEGIAPEVLERVFEPFFTTKEVGRGTGLGLSMVYGFAQQSGGRVRIESEPGRGTRVEVLLPAAAGVEAPAEAGAPRAYDGRGTETILLVEDNAEVRGMAEAVLGETGYRVVVAGNAWEGLDVLHGPERIDLLFTDVVMPGGMNGLELAREARRLRPGLRILTTSGHMGRAEAEEGVPLEFPLLPKPYRRADLLEAVRGALDGAGAADRALRRAG